MSEENITIASEGETRRIMDRLRPHVRRAAVAASDDLDISIVSVIVAMIAELTKELANIDHVQTWELLNAQQVLLDPRALEDLVKEAQEIHDQATISLCQEARRQAKEKMQ